MPQTSFLEALGEAVGRGARRSPGGQAISALQSAAQNLPNIGAESELARQGLIEDFTGLAKDVVDRSQSLRDDLSYWSGPEGLQNPNPLTKALGAARLAANVPGVALETLFQPLRPVRSLVGMSLNQMKRDAGQEANPYSFREGDKAWEEVNPWLRLPAELVAARRLGGAEGANISTGMAKLLGQSGSTVARIASKVEAAPAAPIAAAFSGVINQGRKLPLFQRDTTSTARAVLDADHEEITQLQRALRAAGINLPDTDVARVWNGYRQGDEAATATAEGWLRQIDPGAPAGSVAPAAPAALGGTASKPPLYGPPAAALPAPSSAPQAVTDLADRLQNVGINTGYEAATGLAQRLRSAASTGTVPDALVAEAQQQLEIMQGALSRQANPLPRNPLNIQGKVGLGEIARERVQSEARVFPKPEAILRQIETAPLGAAVAPDAAVVTRDLAQSAVRQGPESVFGVPTPQLRQFVAAVDRDLLAGKPVSPQVRQVYTEARSVLERGVPTTAPRPRAAVATAPAPEPAPTLVMPAAPTAAPSTTARRAAPLATPVAEAAPAAAPLAAPEGTRGGLLRQLLDRIGGTSGPQDAAVSPAAAQIPQRQALQQLLGTFGRGRGNRMVGSPADIQPSPTLVSDLFPPVAPAERGIAPQTGPLLGLTEQAQRAVAASPPPPTWASKLSIDEIMQLGASLKDPAAAARTPENMARWATAMFDQVTSELEKLSTQSTEKQLKNLSELAPYIRNGAEYAKASGTPIPENIQGLLDALEAAGATSNRGQQGVNSTAAQALFERVFGGAPSAEGSALAGQGGMSRRQLLTEPDARQALGLPRVEVPEGEVYKLFRVGVSNPVTVAQRTLNALRAQADDSIARLRTLWQTYETVPNELKQTIQKQEQYLLQAARDVAREGGYTVRPYGEITEPRLLNTFTAARPSTNTSASPPAEAAVLSYYDRMRGIRGSVDQDIALAEELGIAEPIRAQVAAGKRAATIEQQIVEQVARENPDAVDSSLRSAIKSVIADAKNQVRPVVSPEAAAEIAATRSQGGAAAAGKSVLPHELPEPLYVKAVDVAKRDGGATLSPETLEPVPTTEGYSLSPIKDTERTVPLKDFTTTVLRDWVRTRWQEGNLIGLWLDNGLMYMDNSQIVRDFKQAVQMGQAANQEAIYNLKTGELIFLRGAGKVTPEVQAILRQGEAVLRPPAERELRGIMDRLALSNETLDQFLQWYAESPASFDSWVRNAFSWSQKSDTGRLINRASALFRDVAADPAVKARLGGATVAGFAPTPSVDADGNVTYTSGGFNPLNAAVVLGLRPGQLTTLKNGAWAVVTSAAKAPAGRAARDVRLLIPTTSLEALGSTAKALGDLADSVLKQPMAFWRTTGPQGEMLAANLSNFRPTKNLVGQMAAVAQRMGAPKMLSVEFGQGKEPVARAAFDTLQEAELAAAALQKTGHFLQVGIEPNAGFNESAFRVTAIAQTPQQAAGSFYPAAAEAWRTKTAQVTRDALAQAGVTPFFSDVIGARITTFEGKDLTTRAAQTQLPSTIGQAPAPAPGALAPPAANAVPVPAAPGGAAPQQLAPAVDASKALFGTGVDVTKLDRAASRIGGAVQTVQDDTALARETLDALGAAQGRTFSTVYDFLKDRAAVSRALELPATQAGVGKLKTLDAKYQQDLLAPNAQTGTLADRLAVARQRDIERAAGGQNWLERVGDALGTNPVFKALGTYNRYYRPLALLSPRFQIFNVTDQAFKSWIGEGIQPWLKGSTVAEYLGAWEQLKDPARAGELSRTGFGKGRFRIGDKLVGTNEGVNLIEAPRSVVDGFGRSMELAWQRVPFLRTAEQKSRALTSYLEESARLSAYIQGKQRSLLQVLPDFARQVEAAAGKEAGLSVLESQGKLGPTQLKGLLGDAPQARQLLNDWNTILRQGDSAGAALADRIHFNYRYQTNFDTFLRSVLLFHVFSTRNLVYYPQILAQNPAVAATIFSYARGTEQQRTERGLTTRSVGMTSGGDLSTKIAETLFGPNAEILSDPLSYLSLYQQLKPLAKQLIKPDPTLTAPGEAIQGLSNAGFSLTPPLQAGLQGVNALSGDQLLGPNSRSLGLIPQAGVLNAVGGLALGRPVNIEGAPAALAGQTNDGAVRRRIAEMAVEAGQPGAYDRFMLDPSSRVYQDAARQAANATALQTLTGWATGAQVQPISGGEKAIRQAQANSAAPTYDPTAGPAAQGQYRLQKSSGLNTELEQMIQTRPGVLLSQMVVQRQAFRNYLDRLGVSYEEASRLAPEQQQKLLRYYIFDLGGETPALASQAYSPTAPAPELGAARRGTPTEQQYLSRYLSASPAERAALMADPDTAFAVTRYLLGRGGRTNP